MQHCKNRSELLARPCSKKLRDSVAPLPVQKSSNLKPAPTSRTELVASCFAKRAALWFNNHDPILCNPPISES